ncbi:MAG: ubiquinol-cytochrome C chaperone [Rhizobiaceae bacterium]|nr:ubiquinol-cytochrome C chaperone [Rhizobiaceae bacterium]
MFSRLFGRRKSGNREVVDAVYGEIVAAARQPVFYAQWGVPDTPLGRYEMLSAHLFLVLRRLREATPAGKELAQELTDEFFKDVEHSIRELGIGDAGVPKRMKKLARMFYGRVAAYDAALAADDEPALAAALQRNVRADDAAWAGARPLAGNLAAAARGLEGWPESEILRGRSGLLLPNAREAAA